jgi:RNA-directed DNA polymerase
MLAQCRHVSPDVFDVVQDYLCVPDRRRTGQGMVAGGAISPLLGGLYLTPLDRAMEDLCKKNWIRYQRYMDDYVIFAKTRNKLKAAIKRMYAVLDTLQLTDHPDKRYIGKT